MADAILYASSSPPRLGNGTHGEEQRHVPVRWKGKMMRHVSAAFLVDAVTEKTMNGPAMPSGPSPVSLDMEHESNKNQQMWPSGRGEAVERQLQLTFFLIRCGQVRIIPARSALRLPSPSFRHGVGVGRTSHVAASNRLSA